MMGSFVIFAVLLIVVVPFSLTAPTGKDAMFKESKQQAGRQVPQSNNNNFGFGLQEHRMGGRQGGLTPTPQLQEPPQQSESMNLSEVQPMVLQYCFRAIQFILKTAAHVQEVNDITKDDELPPLIAELANSAQKAFIYSEIAMGQDGDPVYEAINSTRNATIVARTASTAALKVASSYSVKPENKNAQNAVQAAQRSTLTAQSAQHQILQAGSGPF